jgi:ribosomal protein S18 acetylase RimI-like enzyme
MAPHASSILIRDLVHTDISAIAGWMMTDHHWVRYGMTVSSIEHDLSDAIERSDIAIVAELDGLPVGFAWGIERGMFGTDAYLKRLGVSPAYTRRSIGSLLLDSVEERCRAAGASYLSLLVGSENERAESFYRARGYACAGALPDFAIDGVEERLYRRRLTPLSY